MQSVTALQLSRWKAMLKPTKGGDVEPEGTSEVPEQHDQGCLLAQLQFLALPWPELAATSKCRPWCCLTTVPFWCHHARLTSSAPISLIPGPLCRKGVMCRLRSGSQLCLLIILSPLVFIQAALSTSERREYLPLYGRHTASGRGSQVRLYHGPHPEHHPADIL